MAVRRSRVTGTRRESTGTNTPTGANTARPQDHNRIRSQSVVSSSTARHIPHAAYCASYLALHTGRHRRRVTSHISHTGRHTAHHIPHIAYGASYTARYKSQLHIARHTTPMVLSPFCITLVRGIHLYCTLWKVQGLSQLCPRTCAVTYPSPQSSSSLVELRQGWLEEHVLQKGVSREPRTFE